MKNYTQYTEVYKPKKEGFVETDQLVRQKIMMEMINFYNKFIMDITGSKPIHDVPGLGIYSIQFGDDFQLKYQYKCGLGSQHSDFLEIQTLFAIDKYKEIFTLLDKYLPTLGIASYDLDEKFLVIVCLDNKSEYSNFFKLNKKSFEAFYKGNKFGL